MNEVEIPIKVTGIAALKAELKDLKDQMADAVDPEVFAALADKAGDVQKKIQGINGAITTFKQGSNFDQAQTAFEDLSTSILSLDFTGAAKKSQNLKQVLGELKPSDLTKKFTGFLSTISNIGGAFIKLGATIMMNPIFKLVAIIMAVVAAVGWFLDKIGVLGVILEYIMIPINIIIDGLKWLGDALGLTSFAEDERAEQAKKNSEATLAQIKKEQEAQQRAYERKQKIYDDSDDALGRQIKLLKAQGKDTTDLERTRLKAAISYQRSIESETYAIAQQLKVKNKLTVAELRASAEETGDYGAWKAFEKEMAAAVKDNYDMNSKANKAKLDAINDLAVFEQELVNDKAKAAADEAKESKNKSDSRKREAASEAITNAANRLSSARKIRDGELSIMKEGLAKEEALTIEKFKRQREDIASNEKLKTAEKITLTAQADAEELAQLEAKREAAKKITIAVESELAQLRIDSMKEGAEKDLVIQNQKYQKLRDAAIADTRLTAEQLKERLDIYNTMQIEEETARMKDKVKAASDLLTELTTTEEEKRIAELDAKYLMDQEMAMGNQKALEILEVNHKKALADINKEAQLKQIEEDQKERDARIALAGDIAKGITDIGGMLIKDQEKLAKFNKASALVQIGIDTAKAISALVANSQANPLNAVSAGAAGIAQFASGIIQIATNVAKAKQILSSPGATPSGGGGGGGGDTGGGTSAATVLPQSAQLFGSANTGGSFSAGGSSSDSSMTVTAVVSETQVTSVQDKINRINKSAEL
jgi:hypothetical protein